MKWPRLIATRLRALFFGADIHKDIDEELRIHLEMQIEEHIAQGLSPEEARLAATREFGNRSVIRELALRVRGGGMLESVWQDIRYGFRMLRRSPGFTVVAVLSLALGIGANTAIFSVVDALILRKLPVNNPDQLVIFKKDPKVMKSGNFTSFAMDPDVERYRGLTEIFSGVSGTIDLDRSNVTTNGADDGMNQEQVRIQVVTEDYFSTMGINSAIGRLLTPQVDQTPGGNPVTVISYGYWKRRFALSPDAIGRTLTFNNTAYTIVGVAPKDFTGDWIGRATDLWMPMSMDYKVESTAVDDSIFVHRVIARLGTGVTVAKAQAAVDVLSPQLAEEYIKANPQLQPWMIQSAKTRIVLESDANGYSVQRDTLTQPLIILTLMVGLILLIACANVANLLLSRAAARQKETAVRLALGAGSARIVRQLLTESVILASLSGILGFIFAIWATDALLKFASSSPAGMLGFGSLNLNVKPGFRILAFTTVLCLFTSILFGLAPALRSSKVSIAQLLSARGTDSNSPIGRFALPKLLVVFQVALSLVLLIGAGLFIRSLNKLKGQDLGFSGDHLLLAWTSPVLTGRQSPAIASLVQQMQERVSRLPGVISASPSSSGLLSGFIGRADSGSVNVQGQSPRRGLWMTRSAVTTGYFETTGTTLLQGREFTDLDNQTAPSVVIINETLAKFEFGDESPVGKHIGLFNDVGTPRTVIGVVKDTKYNSVRDQNIGMIYLPYRQRSQDLNFVCVIVRTQGDPHAVAASVRQELYNLDPNLPIRSIDTIDEQLDLILVQERLVVTLAEFFGAMAVLLSCLGLFGVVSYNVTRRTNEIGIRMALGAQRLDVLTMVLRESMALVAAGTVIGLLAALGTTRLISDMLFGVGPFDSVTVILATLLLFAVAAVAGFLPANKASRVDPIIALRAE